MESPQATKAKQVRQSFALSTSASNRYWGGTDTLSEATCIVNEISATNFVQRPLHPLYPFAFWNMIRISSRYIVLFNLKVRVCVTGHSSCSSLLHTCSWRGSLIGEFSLGCWLLLFLITELLFLSYCLAFRFSL